MTYEEYLKSCGATDEDLKTIVTPASRRAFEKMQSDVVAAQGRAEEATRLKTDTDKWYYDIHVPEFQTMQNSVVTAQAEAARYKEALRAAEKQGLINVAKDLGFNVNDTPPAAAAAAAAPFDTSKFITREQLLEVARAEGKSIARMTKMAEEHSRLGLPPVDWESLYDEAVTAGKPVGQFWEQKFNVSSVRQARADSDKSAYEKKLRDEGASAERARIAEQGNPDIRPGVPSRAPWTQRTATDTLRAGTNPWDAKSEHVLSDDRVRRVASKIMTQ
jgi:hypothetical protein